MSTTFNWNLELGFMRSTTNQYLWTFHSTNTFFFVCFACEFFNVCWMQPIFQANQKIISEFFVVVVFFHSPILFEKFTSFLMHLSENTCCSDWFGFKDQALPAHRPGGVVEGRSYYVCAFGLKKQEVCRASFMQFWQSPSASQRIQRLLPSATFIKV